LINLTASETFGRAGVTVGQEIDNEDLTSIFKCSPQGDMRNLRTNSFIVVSDNTGFCFF